MVAYCMDTNIKEEGVIMIIDNVKEYLKSLAVVLGGLNDPTGMNTKTCECITALLDYCEDLEVCIEKDNPGYIKILNASEEKQKQ